MAAQVALPTEKVRLVFRLAKPEDAEAVAERFGVERFALDPPITLKTSGRPERLLQN
jgi:hypothetical protein